MIGNSSLFLNKKSSKYYFRITTGAQDDLQKVTKMAYAQIRYNCCLSGFPSLRKKLVIRVEQALVFLYAASF
jgi:hypothetical protein